jgi:hypothetical protein
LNFDKLPAFVEKGKEADLGADYKSNVQKEVAKLKSQA